jgi:hypothetical protein
MEDLFANLLCANSCTLLVGITIFVVGQVVARFFIEPMHEQRVCLRQIANAWVFYANRYMNPEPWDSDEPPERRESRAEAHKVFRQRASELVAKTYSIPLYGLWQHLPMFPTRADVDELWIDLLDLSDGVYLPDKMLRTKEAADDIETRLHIRPKSD